MRLHPFNHERGRLQFGDECKSPDQPLGPATDLRLDPVPVDADDDASAGHLAPESFDAEADILAKEHSWDGHRLPELHLSRCTAPTVTNEIAQMIPRIVQLSGS
jgi:hypothetical protein